jgi:hypothetical protein
MSSSSPSWQSEKLLHLYLFAIQMSDWLHKNEPSWQSFEPKCDWIILSVYKTNNILKHCKNKITDHNLNTE